MLMLFSFIVPIYNAEKYLFECLSSIEKQTYRDFEVWMIDDGSTDRSSSIASSFAIKDDRFHYVRQENQGTSAATNKGLSLVNGEYVINLDNDDYVDSELLSTSAKVIEAHSPDIVQFQSIFIDASGAENSRQTFFAEPIVYNDNSELCNCEKTMPGAFNRTHSRKAFRRSILEGIWFEGTSKGADTSFLRRVLFRCKKVVLRPETMFFVRELSTSESRKPSHPYLYKEWFDREIADIDFCIKENVKYNRVTPFWVFADVLDMWQLFTSKALRDAFFDKSYFKKTGRLLYARRHMLMPKKLKEKLKWMVWLRHPKFAARRLSKKIPEGDFII